ncbi:MAG TPA: acetate--CoA ligase family protein [Thermoanaerobaculia bacterium]|nr:acetate--CoA ligase family protein [Thermoanaerobaculia bacterium]
MIVDEPETQTSPVTRALDPIFSPRAIAVVGASRRRDSIGFALLHNLIASEFNGAIFPVNPQARVIHSLKCYPSLAAIPDAVDLAVVMVPRRLVQGVVEECIAKGVKGLVVITAGFSETGEEGARLEKILRETVRAAGVRMIGPNCMGVINTEAEVSLNATFAPTPARAGSIGFVSQSGALGVAILNVAQDLGIGLTQFVSMGNKADVSGNDLLVHWEDDPETRVICMYLESFGNPRRFTEIAKRVTRKKPILLVKSGRTAEGARAASSHTGAIAGTDVTVSAFLDQCGVLRANTIEELFDVARALDRCPLPEGNRVAIVTNAGGPAIMATDACVNLGLQMAELADATREELRSFLPAEASVANPVDMIASATADSYSRTLARVLDDPGVDMALVINVTPLLSNPIDIIEAAGAVARGRSKPVLAVMMATDEFYESVKEARDLPPVYRFPESAARALFMLARYAAWRRRPAEGAVPEFATDDRAVAEILDRTPDGYLDPASTFEVLDLYGIPLAAWKVARDKDAALAAAREIGYPVVLKAIAPDLVHKSDVGAVRIDLRDDGELSGALSEMTSRVEEAGHRVEGFLVQKMVRGGHEVIFGITTDPRFGPLLMFGLGGKYVEVFQDVRFAVPPLEAIEARDVIAGIRGFKLLEGVRGEAGADLDLLAEVLLRLAQLAQRHPRVRELDVNPFLAGPDRASAVALDARIRVEGASKA